MVDTPKTRRSLPQNVADRLKRRIVNGDFPPGSYLPSEREMAQALSVSRQTVGIAMELLEGMGLIVRQQGRGTMVAFPAPRSTSHAQVLIVGELPGNDPNTYLEQPQMERGIIETLSEFGYACVRREAADFLGDQARELKAFAGVVVEEAGNETYSDLALQLEEQRVPVVIANLEVDPLPVAHTCLDHDAIVRRAVGMLLDFGHRRIGFIGYDPSRYFYGKALAAYRAVLEQADIPFDCDLVAASNAPRALAGYRGALRMLTMDNPPSAFFAARDAYAQGIWMAVEEAGMVVGREVSIIGFDDVTWPTDDPKLTTFREPTFELGAVAARMLLERIIGGRQTPERRVLDAPLVLRRSAGPHHEQSNDRVFQSRRQLASSLLSLET